MDISTLRAADTHRVLIKGVRGEQIVGRDGVPCAVVVAGPGSAQYMAAQGAASDRLLAQVKAAKDGKPEPLTPRQSAEENAHFLADCTVAFEGFDYQGKTGREGFVACYADRGMAWLTSQVDQGIADWRNFVPASPVG